MIQRSSKGTAPHVDKSSFAIVSNGFGDGPAQALRDFLIARHARYLVTITHPLLKDGNTKHHVCEWRHGQLACERRVRLPSRPPFTYPLDLLVPVWPAPVDAWLGFNALACWRGIAARVLGRADRVAYWCVDYVDNRFGTGVLTRAFEVVDRICCQFADIRFEPSQGALDARSVRHTSRHDRLAPAKVVPMGAWLDRVPITDTESHAKRRVVYLGHLVPRQGVAVLIDAISILHRGDADVSADIVGGGPMEGELRQRAHKAGLDDVIKFHGYIEDHRLVERILAGGSVAAATYDTTIENFSRFADPGKLKIYAAVGLPMVLTDVPPNARGLAQAGAAELTVFTPEAVAAAIERVLRSSAEWNRRREASLRVARQYDWNLILTGALRALGFSF